MPPPADDPVADSSLTVPDSSLTVPDSSLTVRIWFLFR